ncbi:MAG: transporter substrate-binding domain-containing protein [Clostridia bacterium]|nr:transporter substrate-binding domain-containing protein [Clostridia bacterium]
MRVGTEKKLARKLAALLALCMLCATLAACGPDPTAAVEAREAEEAMQQAQEQARMTLRVGVKSTVKSFGFQDVMTGEFSGLEVDIAYLLAQSMGYDSVELMSVHADERARLLETGRLDCVIATFTVTQMREETVDFSTPYYTDYTAVMVRADSGIDGIAALTGKKIAVQRGATAAAAIVEELIRQGAIPAEAYDADNFDPASWTEAVTFVVCADAAAADMALREGDADAFSTDQSILNSYLRAEDRLLPDHLMPQPYGVATAEGSPLTAQIDALMKGWQADGTLEALCAKYGI